MYGRRRSRFARTVRPSWYSNPRRRKPVLPAVPLFIWRGSSWNGASSDIDAPSVSMPTLGEDTGDILRPLLLLVPVEQQFGFDHRDQFWNPLPGFAIGEEEWLSVAHQSRIAFHHLEAGVHVRRQVRLVDDQDV